MVRGLTVGLDGEELNGEDARDVEALGDGEGGGAGELYSDRKSVV